MTAAAALGALCTYFLVLFLFGLYWRNKERPHILGTEVGVGKRKGFHGGDSTPPYKEDSHLARSR